MPMPLMKYVAWASFSFWTALVCGCAPVSLWDAHTMSTPRPPPSDVAALAHGPVAMLGPLAPSSLQGFSPFLSHALLTAFAQASPPLPGHPLPTTVSALNEHGLAAEYAELLAGFVRSGILERERLRRIGAALGTRYVLVPGLAEFNEALVDKFEYLGLKLFRTRVTTLRLWLQLWDAQRGQMLWEAAGEITVSSDLFRAQRTVALDEIAQRLWLRMLQEHLLEGRTRFRLFFRE
jgi:hypothetical protein